MKRPMLIMLALMTLFFGGIFGWKAFVGLMIQKDIQAAGMPVATVSTAAATTATWTPVINAVGSLRAMRGVDVTPQAEGLVTELYFDSGDTVNAGDLLVQQYVEDEQAQLVGLVAARELAELNFKRNQDLIRQKLLSEFEFDTSRTELQRARAAEDELRLRIRKKSIRAPFAGQLGIRKIDLGQYIEPGDTIARLEARDEILVDFPVPQRQFSQLSIDQPIQVRVDAWPEQVFKGEIKAIEPAVERETRNIRARGILPNAAGELVPGMFAKISIELPVQQQVVTVPQAAIVYSPYGDSVYVVEERLTESGERQQLVVNTFIVLGETRGDQAAIASGLKPGMIVVTSGQQKLRNNTVVQINNSVAVSNDPEPQPSNN